MKRFLTTFVLVLLSVFSFSQGPQTIINVPTGSTNSPTSIPAILYTPPDYPKPGVNYPLILFFHGSGEAGTDPSQIYTSAESGGPSYFIAQGQWPISFTNPSDGQQYQFIVVSPQYPNWSTPGSCVNFILTYLLDHYNIDINRVYLTGLSAGGQTVYDYTTYNGFTSLYNPAAIVPMSMATDPTNAGVAQTLADNVYVWGFGSETDIWGIETHMYLIGSYDGNNGPTPPAIGSNGRFSDFVGGHCCWDNFYTPTYTETINGVTMNIYQWMLTHTRNVNLPITLVSFTVDVSSTDVFFNWETALESNSLEFVIQRSYDGVSFSDLDTIPSAASNGNSSQSIYYSYQIYF